MPLLTAPLRPRAGAAAPPWCGAAARSLRVGRDVVRSASRWPGACCAPAGSRRAAHFVVVPLDLRDANGLAALAMITTVVPGTVWSELALDRSALLLHVFDLDDEDAFIAHFKARYEQPLMEIFE